MILLLAFVLTQEGGIPVAVDDRLVIELVARDPDLATPTGIAVDPGGRIWVVENNTHMRPKEYKGRPTDRILIFDDFGPDGRARKITTFAEGFRHGMGLAWRGPGEVILVTRNDIARLRDLDGDGRADDRLTLVRLDTTGTYDHNGLFGPAFDGLGDLYFGLGGNTSGEFPFGAPYTLVGSDGSTHSEDEGGRIFKCRSDGSKVAFVAKGFWNPFHLAFDGLGRLFAVDNDPDERPPCRLLHVVPGGDFGFRRRNGGRGLHPFTSWDGEIPGTLPMVAGTGEAPSGIVAHEDTLLVTAWGDHEIQRFRLAARGASFSSRAETVIRGGESFRPVGIVVAPDGSVCISDWVDRSYPVHGKGALWRIRPRKSIERRPAGLEGPGARLQALWAGRVTVDHALRDGAEEVRGEAARLLPAEDPRRLSLAASDSSAFVRLQALLGVRVDSREVERLLPFLAGSDPFLSSAATSALARTGDGPSLARHLSSKDFQVRLGVLLALRL
ncbi:MAG: PVC-type heme-binding CxxCH protein, partial [Actinomycetota bacterium]